MDATTTKTPLGLLPLRRHGRRQRAAAAAAGGGGGGGEEEEEEVCSLAYRFLEPLLCELRLLLAPRPLYGPVKATMLADGHAVAAGLAVAAVLGNHVRRVLAPWLGQFLWWHPVQAMRLARGSPHLFIEQQVLQSSSAATDAATTTLGFWALQTAALAATKALLRHCLLADATTTTTTTNYEPTVTTPATGLTNPKSRRGKGVAGGGRSSSSSSSSSSSTGPRAAAMRATTSSMACLTDCYRIIYLTLCIMHVEYAYAEACWAASWIHAATHVALRGTAAEKLFTHRLLLTGRHRHDQHPARTESDGGAAMAAHWRGLSLIAGLLAWWSWRHVLRPLRRHGVVAWAFSGLPVLGGLVGAGTAHVIKHSNKYFIWLEMSEMLLTWAWLLLALALVAAWRVCDGQEAE